MTAAAIAATTVIAACGSNSASSSSSGGNLTQAQAQHGQQDMVRFADCLRSHGVPNFPDSGSPVFKNAVNTNSPAFGSAYTACKHLQPGGGPPNQNSAPSQAHIAAMLAFARCIRSHGFPNFPDPDSGGQLTPQMATQAGINLDQPAVLQAADACLSVTHGVITKVDVARALHPFNAAGK